MPVDFCLLGFARCQGRRMDQMLLATDALEEVGQQALRRHSVSMELVQLADCARFGFL